MQHKIITLKVDTTQFLNCEKKDNLQVILKEK